VKITAEGRARVERKRERIFEGRSLVFGRLSAAQRSAAPRVLSSLAEAMEELR